MVSFQARQITSILMDNSITCQQIGKAVHFHKTVLPLQQTVMQQKASSKAAKQQTVEQQTAMQQSSNLEGGKSQLLLLKKLSV